MDFHPHHEPLSVAWAREYCRDGTAFPTGGVATTRWRTERSSHSCTRRRWRGRRDALYDHHQNASPRVPAEIPLLPPSPTAVFGEPPVLPLARRTATQDEPAPTGQVRRHRRNREEEGRRRRRRRDHDRGGHPYSHPHCLPLSLALESRRHYLCQTHVSTQEWAGGEPTGASAAALPHCLVLLLGNLRHRPHPHEW